MIKKLLVAALLVLAVLYIGDPYAPENSSLAPYLPPAIDESKLLAFRDSTSTYIDEIPLEETWTAISEHEVTHQLLETLMALKSYLTNQVFELAKDPDVLAQIES